MLAGRFTVAGQTRELGTDPDWLGADVPSDDEWRIEWVKFAWGLDLAHAAAETGDPAYRAAWERLVASWIEQVPHDHDAAEVTARRILNWVVRRPAVRRPRRASPDSIDRQARHVLDNLAPARNHRTLELYALFVVGARARPKTACATSRSPARPQPRGRLPAGRRPPRGLDPLPRARPPLAPRPAGERPPLRPRRAGRVRRPPRARVPLRRALPPAGRHDPGALGRRHGRLPAAARLDTAPRDLRRAGSAAHAGAAARASRTAATSSSAADGARPTAS